MDIVKLDQQYRTEARAHAGESFRFRYDVFYKTSKLAHMMKHVGRIVEFQHSYTTHHYGVGLRVKLTNETPWRYWLVLVWNGAVGRWSVCEAESYNPIMQEEEIRNLLGLYEDQLIADMINRDQTQSKEMNKEG